MAMSGTFHLTTDYFPGYTLSASKCFTNSVLSKRTLVILPTKGSNSFVCRASNNPYRRNPDFSRLSNKNNLRVGRNRDGDVENGNLLSLSNSPKFQATSLPGPREKEIVELFRKVQSQLRARRREGRKIDEDEDSSEGYGKESESVDSLLKLLRKHSGEQSKDNTSSFNRPTSSFRRKSPVPRFDQGSSYSVTWTQKKDLTVEPVNEVESEYEEESVQVSTLVEPESELKQESLSLYKEENDDDDDESLVDGGVTFDVLSDDDESQDDTDEGEEDIVKEEELSTLKVVELRGVAKSRGLKGFSKMKKAQLLELLA